MKVTAFNGSPRKDGNTALLLRAVLAPIAEAGIETELVQVGGTNIHGCRACMQCAARKDRRCVFDDDDLNAHLEKMLASDGIILGSPSYFASVTPELKALIDRAGFVAGMNGRAFARKIGAAVAAHRRGGGIQVMNTINQMFLMSRMIVPGSTYWNFGVGRERGEVASDQEALANMKDLGETIAWLLPRVQGG
jgi:multimeric flavodoxin WrbA